jgi:hypothetical protein
MRLRKSRHGCESCNIDYEVMLLFGISLILDIRTTLATVDEQADDEIVPLHGLRDTACSSGEALDARPQRQMLTFQLLRIAFAHFMASRSKVALVRSPPIRVKAPDPKRHEPRFQLQQCEIFPPPKHISQDFPGTMIQRMPQPPRRLFLTYEGPHFIEFCGLHSRQHHVYVCIT